jgi:hypothetical protein
MNGNAPEMNCVILAVGQVDSNRIAPRHASTLKQQLRLLR